MRVLANEEGVEDRWRRAFRLTEEEFFHGSLKNLRDARRSVACPFSARISFLTPGKCGKRAPMTPTVFS